jgi:hypothetical protein
LLLVVVVSRYPCKHPSLIQWTWSWRENHTSAPVTPENWHTVATESEPFYIYTYTYIYTYIYMRLTW